MHGQHHLVGQRANGDITLHRAPDDFVINVGDVADVGHLQARRFQPALGNVKRHHHAGMADVAKVINRHAAHIHSHMARV